MIWFGYVCERDTGYITRKMLRMELAGCEEQRKARYMDAIKADKQVVGVTEKDSHERNQCKCIMQLW